MFEGNYVRDADGKEGLHAEFVAEGFAAIDTCGGADEVEASEDGVELDNRIVSRQINRKVEEDDVRKSRRQ